MAICEFTESDFVKTFQFKLQIIKSYVLPLPLE